ncbi:soluble NSF attachment protein [Circinella umbellata]|nr:soluble NSF attachment protein [Circinella umbellata]
MSERQAQELLQAADKRLNGWSFFGGGNKQEEAAELYEKAGNTFKLAQRWSEAGEAFIKAAGLFNKIPDTQYEASKSYENAAKCYKKNNPEEAVRALESAIMIDKDGAHFRNAAKHHQEIAEIYESDIVDLQGAMKNWEEAAHLYMADDSQAMVNKCLLKVAHFAAQLEQYDIAIDKLEAVATASMDNQLTKWSLKEYFLKAGLCHLCTNDLVHTRQALDKYCTMDITFENTREYQFLQAILDCVDNGEIEIFTQKVYEFDQMTKLDHWKTTILLRIKKTINEEPSLL